MFETMYDAPGIGLAASQVDVHQRFMVIDISEEKNQPQVFINPELSDKAGLELGSQFGGKEFVRIQYQHPVMDGPAPGCGDEPG